MNCIDLEISPNAESLAIPGVTYIPDYINDDEHNQLLDIVDQQPWSIDSIEQTRKIQQHGYRLDYHQGFLVASIIWVVCQIGQTSLLLDSSMRA
jgi:hypothetical protein